MVDVKVEVRGIRELATAFKRVDAELPKQLKAKFLTVAQHIVGMAQGRMPHVSGRAAASIKARASARGASIAFGGQAAEYEPWLEFGGRVGRNKSVQRPFMPGGRYLYPAISEARPETEAAIEAAINETVKEAGFETR